MRFKGTFALLLIAILFGGFIYFYEYKGSEKREALKKTEKRVWRFDAEDIVRVDLASRESRMIAERGDDGQWKITAPQQWLADGDQLNRLASYAARLDNDGVVESDAADLAQFGLAPAGLELRLTAKDGAEYGIAFGENNPAGGFAYSALIGEREVFLVSADAARSFEASAEDFRDRSVFGFERSGVQGVILRNVSGIVELEKDRDDRWWFTGPERREADGPAVRGLLNALHLGKIPEFFDEDAGEYVNASLEKPEIDVVLTFGPGNTIKRLVIGPEKSRLQKKSRETARGAAEQSPDDDQEIFLARDDSRNELFFVEKTLVEKLSASAGELRDKTLVPFQRWDVDAIILENAGGTFQFEKVDGEWFLVTPSKKKADWNEINNILDALEKPLVQWIDDPGSLDDYGMNDPSASVILKKGNAVIAECVFGSYTTRGVYAKVNGDSSIKVADTESLELLSEITGKQENAD